MAANTLLIDDDAKLVASVKARFKKAGVRLDTALTWDDGLAKFRACLHQLVIVDYNLDGVRQGLMLMAAMKPLRPATRLILFSGELPSGVDSHFKDSKLIDRYIQKASGVTSELLDEARQADQRASEEFAWTDLAKAYVASGEIDAADVKAIDDLLTDLHAGNNG